MKIGILTYHAVYNFGANLQALSTFNFLKKEGHSPIFIDFFPEELAQAFDRTVTSQQATAHKAFVLKNFNQTARCLNARDVANEIETNNIEAVIIGSDAVLQHFPLLTRIRIYPSRKKLVVIRMEAVHYDTNFPNPFWGEFLNHLNKQIGTGMMSVSCQNTDFKLFSKNEKKLINNMIGKMSFISVRDKRTQGLIKYVSGGKIVPTVTPDPVFYFNQNVEGLPSKKEILAKFGLPDNYILLSFNNGKIVSNQWVDLFSESARKLGYHSVALPMPDKTLFGNTLDHQISLPLDPLDWYCLIKYSSGYIGEKMHPIIVSIHNAIPFFCFDNYGITRFKIAHFESTSKIYQLLETAGLQKYRFSTKRLLTSPPNPEVVLKHICSFDKELCLKFANRMQNDYASMMYNLIKSFRSF